jgi:hypothetical protein
MLLIWTLIQVSLQVVVHVGKLFHQQGTIECVMMLGHGNKQNARFVWCSITVRSSQDQESSREDMKQYLHKRVDVAYMREIEKGRASLVFSYLRS